MPKRIGKKKEKRSTETNNNETDNNTNGERSVPRKVVEYNDESTRTTNTVQSSRVMIDGEDKSNKEK